MGLQPQKKGEMWQTHHKYKHRPWWLGVWCIVVAIADKRWSWNMLPHQEHLVSSKFAHKFPFYIKDCKLPGKNQGGNSLGFLGS